MMALQTTGSSRVAGAEDGQRLVQLMRQVAQNLDRDAFSQLFDVLAPRIRASLMKAGVDRAKADDLLQDVMVTVWTKAGLFDSSRGSVFAWVYTIARNARVDRARRERREIPLDLIEWDPADDSRSSEEKLVWEGESKSLRVAMADIAPEQRECIELAYVQELTQVQIAQRLNLPLGTVKSRMRLAFAKLRKALEN